MRRMKESLVAMVCLAMTLASAASAQQRVEDEASDAAAREVAGEDAEGEQILDEEGRVIAERLPDGSTVRYLYDAEGVRYVVDE